MDSHLRRRYSVNCFPATEMLDRTFVELSLHIENAISGVINVLYSKILLWCLDLCAFLALYFKLLTHRQIKKNLF
jgi:hypothetical protein